MREMNSDTLSKIRQTFSEPQRLITYLHKSAARLFVQFNLIEFSVQCL